MISSCYELFQRSAMVVVLGVMFAVPAHGELRTFTLQQMAQRSAVILIGTVIRLERNGKGSLYGFEANRYTATLEVEEILKGDPSLTLQPVDFYLHPEQPQFRIGERAVLFFEHYKDRLRVFNGVHGEVPIIEDPPKEYKVRTVFIFNEPKEQRLEEFVAKIRSLVAAR